MQEALETGRIEDSDDLLLMTLGLGFEPNTLVQRAQQKVNIFETLQKNHPKNVGRFFRLR
jgi:hypothetical protein